MSVIDGAVNAGGLLNCIAENLLTTTYANNETNRATRYVTTASAAG